MGPPGTPAGRGAVVAGLVWGVRLRRPGGAGLDEAAGGAGLRDPARSKTAVDRLITRREVHLREKTLRRMLYETAARAEEILGLNIEDLDLAARRCP